MKPEYDASRLVEEPKVLSQILHDYIVNNNDEKPWWLYHVALDMLQKHDQHNAYEIVTMYQFIAEHYNAVGRKKDAMKALKAAEKYVEGERKLYQKWMELTRKEIGEACGARWTAVNSAPTPTLRKPTVPAGVGDDTHQRLLAIACMWRVGEIVKRSALESVNANDTTKTAWLDDLARQGFLEHNGKSTKGSAYTVRRTIICNS